MADWTLTVGATRVDLDSSLDEVDGALSLFVGHPVVAIELEPVVVRFHGPGDPSIVLAPMKEADPADDLFKLYLPGHRVLKVSPSGSLVVVDERTI